MARRPRLSVAGVPQHVIQRGNNRQPTFFADEDYRFYLDCLWEAAAKHGCQVHNYVLMTNHVHLLVTPTHADALPRTMQAVGRRYVQQRVNFIYGRSGTLWEGRYKACLVDSSRYFLTCCRYIELNPVRAGMVGQPENYGWSSHRHYAFGGREERLSLHDEYQSLGSTPAARQQAYRALFRESLDALRVEEIRETINRGWPLGGERFKDEIEAAAKRTARPPRRGRPTMKCGPDPI
jgi:putative transposase